VAAEALERPRQRGRGRLVPSGEQGDEVVADLAAAERLARSSRASRSAARTEAGSASPSMRAYSSASTRSTARVKRFEAPSDMAMSRGAERVIASASAIAARSGASGRPKTTWSITSSVSACMRSCVATGRPFGHDASSSRASEATSGRTARMRSPWKGGSMSRRARRCSSPSSRGSRSGPRRARAPTRARAPEHVRPGGEDLLDVGGVETSTIGACAQCVRRVNGSPWRRAQRRRKAVGRATHSAVCAARGSRGPGGSADVTRGARRGRRGRAP
jgi:hypothetical protein